MNTGMTLEELAKELQRQTSPDVRKDFIAPFEKLGVDTRQELVTTDGGREEYRTEPVLRIGDDRDPLYAPILPVADNQLASHLNIPKKYYDYLKTEMPGEFARHMTERFHAREDARMVRTLDGNVRAMLSPRYRPLDNYWLAERGVLPALVDANAQVVSSHVNESRMMIKATAPYLEAEVAESRRVGDVVRGGVVVSNNEVGQGSLSLEMFLEFLFCGNGMISTKLLKKFHVGQRAEVSEDAYEMLSDDTRRRDDELFWQKAKELTRGAFKEEAFQGQIKRLEDLTHYDITDKGAKVQDVVELTVDHLALPPATGDSILDNLVKGGDLSRYGLMNAVTAAANDLDDYDLSTDLERAGGRIMQMPDREWSQLVAA